MTQLSKIRVEEKMKREPFFPGYYSRSTSSQLLPRNLSLNHLRHTLHSLGARHCEPTSTT